jgi:amino acid permease
MEANSVSAWTTMSFTTSFRISGGISSTVSYFRTPADAPHRISRTGSIVPPSLMLLGVGGAVVGALGRVGPSMGATVLAPNGP